MTAGAPGAHRYDRKDRAPASLELVMHRLLPGIVALLLIPVADAGAANVFETYRVPTVGGAEVNVEVMRDSAATGPVPVLLTYSPYNTLGEGASGNMANDATAQTWVPRGYARAVADVIGTRASSGCWDYGGAKETQSGVDLVKFLASRPWANGRVGMMGTSYDGTTANMVASRGAQVPELKAIVPIASISRWYGYAYGNGVRYFGNSESASDEGFDTPLLFDFGFGRTAPPPDHPGFASAAPARVNPCDADTHTTKAYDQSPDYDAFWVERDYRRHARDFRAAVLVAHGWQDYNVKQEEGISLFEDLPVDDPATPEAEGVPLKRMFLTQGRHGSPSGTPWNNLLRAFLDRYLKGLDTGVEGLPLVQTLGRSVGDDGTYKNTTTVEESAWPPAGAADTTLWIRRSFDQDIPGVTVPQPGTGENGTLDPQPNTTATDNIFTWFDTGAATEEASTRDPLNDPGHGYYSLYHKSAPLTKATRMTGAAVLDAYVRASSGATLAPVLVDVTPGGTLKTVARGFLNLDYRDGLQTAKPGGSAWVHARLRFLPQDFTFPAGHRIGLLLQSSNTVWALPGTPGSVNIATGAVAGVTPSGSRLVLPIVG
jgi:X-Pro dipeptidyl-peptidase